MALFRTDLRIGKLIVKPTFQNQGLGKRLMEAIEMQFNQCSVFELFTGHRSDKNLNLYKKLGYEPFNTEQLDDRLTLIYLRKQP